MKKLFYLTLAFSFMLLSMTACKKQTQSAPASAAQQFQAGLTNNDTLTMLQLSDSCMNLLMQRDINAALTMLYEYDDSTHTVLPLSEESANAYRQKFTMFPVNIFDLTEFSFYSDGINDVRYEVTFGYDENNNRMKTAFMFNPVKINDTWFLTVKKPGQDIASYQ